MEQIDLDFFKVIFDDLAPESLKKRFLRLLLKIQNVDRGSIWVKREDRYVCVESLGSQADTDIITGTSISANRPRIVGWVMENAEMTVGEAGKDPRHYKEFETGCRFPYI